jgi:hypothetical protein
MCQFSDDSSDDGDVSLYGQVISMNDIFWYLRSMLQSDRVIDKYASHIIRTEWVKWRLSSYILCDKKI